MILKKSPTKNANNDITLGEKSQTQNHRYCLIHLIGNILKKVTGEESKIEDNRVRMSKDQGLISY